MDPVLTLLEMAGLPATDANRASGDLALGRALVWAGQEYLARVSDEWDIELFFEVYGQPRADGAWAQAIMAGFDKRPDISAQDREGILRAAQDRAKTRFPANPAGIA